MGLRGPAPKPTALKIAQGNPGKRRLADKEPVPPSGEIEAPPWLSPQAREVWARIAPVARAMHTLTTADVETFARYCQWFARWIELDRFVREQLAGNPYYYRRDDKGRITYVGEFPQNAELRRITYILTQLEREFGLTPAARTRIRVELGGATVAPAAPSPGASKFRSKFLDPIPITRGA